MRKILLMLLIALLLTLLVMTTVYGVTLSDFHLGYCVQDIIDKNKELDDYILYLQDKIDTDYENSKLALNSSFNKLQTKKETYYNRIQYSTEEEIKEANTTEQYKMDFLWANIGLYGTRNNCKKLRIEISNGTSGITNEYNLNFSLVGYYLDISEFVYAIEKDPNLGFKIEEFTLVSDGTTGDENDLRASFIVKNVAIDPNSLKDTSSSSVNETKTDSTSSTQSPSPTTNPSPATSSDGTTSPAS